MTLKPGHQVVYGESFESLDPIVQIAHENGWRLTNRDFQYELTRDRTIYAIHLQRLRPLRSSWNRLKPETRKMCIEAFEQQFPKQPDGTYKRNQTYSTTFPGFATR